MKDLLKDFLQFDRNNPRIWEYFVEFTIKAIKRGYNNFGSDWVMNRIRWEVNVETQGAGMTDDGSFIPLKINNNHSAYYARKFHETYPEYGKVFRTRSVRCKKTQEELV